MDRERHYEGGENQSPRTATFQPTRETKPPSISRQLTEGLGIASELRKPLLYPPALQAPHGWSKQSIYTAPPF